MAEIIAVAVITVLAVISPGADFAMIVRNSYLYGRTAGLFAAAGIGLGVLVHVAYTMLGVGLLLSGTPVLFTVVKIVGACYLVWIGYKTFSARAEAADTTTEAADPEPRASRLQSLRTGFLTNALNPKTMLFVVSTYTQVVHRDTPLAQQAGYGLFMALTHLVWFGLAAGLFSAPALRSRMLRRQKALNRGIGAVLMALGVSLVFASA
ncbi:LysE family translocator [Streptomyces sudanensis]|uniref:LysE family translocator n=1 Tax=Streptomyces sudanensis TaxID=436397 RepID=UPI0020CBD5C4|nr:LysE family translocator [Streptomyces sudanensis]MCP9958490.1 LysE family translocator [Streptomyces sudanensis]MCQ0000999.1 LysE family translocator [Streptomyces sudanensis]